MSRPIHLLFENLLETDILERALSILLEHGADINAKDKYGCTALTVAARESSEEDVELLLKFGADVTCDDGYSLIHAQYLETIQVLLDAGMDVNHVSEYGETVP